MTNKEIADTIRKIAFQCNSQDVNSCEFGNEFSLRVQKLLDDENKKCDWCGKETGENVSVKHLHESCYHKIIEGEGLM